MKILLLVTGSISAYKTVDIANALRYEGHDVKIALTKSALQFIPKLTFTGQRYECYTDEDEWNGSEMGVLHINLAKWADTVLLAPATSNTIGKLVNGITDNLVMSILRAFKGTIYIAPAMNTQMYYNSEIFMNKLSGFNVIVIPPQEKLLACGDTGIGGLADKKVIIPTLLQPIFPIASRYVGTTADSDSFKNINVPDEVEVPTHNHCGAYGVTRMHNQHNGVDLYTYDGKPVYASEPGIIEAKGDFTGEKVKSKWWNDTQYVAIRNGDTTINMYGEITMHREITSANIGDTIKKGQLLGFVKPVLLKDKGRPMSMLHFERHQYTFEDKVVWNMEYINRPTKTIDPSGYLMESQKRIPS